jgi:hypothetical protein
MKIHTTSPQGKINNKSNNFFLLGRLDVVFIIDTTSVDPAATVYPIMKYGDYSGNFSDVIFFNNNDTARPVFLNITDQTTYVQFEGML